MAITEAQNRAAAVPKPVSQVTQLNNNTENEKLKDKKLDSSNFRFGEISYPEGVSTDVDKQHYIQFFINVRSKSEFLTGEEKRRREDIKKGAIDQAAKDAVNENRIQNNSLKSIAGVATTGAKAGGLASATIGLLNKSKLGTIVGSAVGTAVGFVAGKEVVEKLEEATGKIAEQLAPDFPMRIKDVITLHIQDRPAVNYSVQYTEDSLGTFGGLAGQTDLSKLGANDYTSNLGKEAAAALGLQALQAVGGLAGSVANGRRLVESGLKNVTNPFREQFFERVDFRTFNFRHTFMAKNESELNSIRDIIKCFKFHMHPELVGTYNLMFLYPSEFLIKYMYKDAENDFFNKISTCVLEDMNVEYGGDIFATFENGAPVEVNMTLRFKELELVTKERIVEDGL